MRADDKRTATENVRLRKVAKFGVDGLHTLTFSTHPRVWIELNVNGSLNSRPVSKN